MNFNKSCRDEDISIIQSDDENEENGGNEFQTYMNRAKKEQDAR